jgi:circadian clock protein KaiC
MAHSNQIREFLLTDKGVELANVYVGPAGVLTGSARLSQEAQEKADQRARRQEVELKQLNLGRKRKAMEAQIAAIRAGFEAEEAEVKKLVDEERLRQETTIKDREEMSRLRKAD